MSGHSKHFIAHEHCQSMIMQRWRGNYVGSGCMLAESSTWTTVLARALCQFLPELLGEGAVLGNLLSEVVGSQGILQELACLISMPGSEQQPLHPDTYWTSTPSAYTAFVALQDVDEEMGPTIYLPGTHTKEAHTDFFGGDWPLEPPEIWLATAQQHQRETSGKQGAVSAAARHQQLVHVCRDFAKLAMKDLSCRRRGGQQRSVRSGSSNRKTWSTSPGPSRRSCASTTAG